MPELATSDPKNITGFSTLMKDDGNRYDILALEKEVIHGSNLLVEEEDNTNQFKQDMDRLANTFNINDFHNTDEPPHIDMFNSSVNSNVNANDIREFASHNFSSNDNNGMGVDSQLQYMTLEQKKQNYVDDVLHDMDNDETLEFDIDKEREEDEKNALLEQIDMLRDTLEDDGISLLNVPLVSKSNSISDIKNIYKILRLKNDRNRYCSFAEEIILSGAHGIEYLFDGKNDWFGRQPDLRGWSNTVRIKLRRCRFQTSSLVKEMMQDYSLSSGFQILLELIPSMFLYSRQKKIADQDHSADESRYDDAISQLNEQN